MTDIRLAKLPDRSTGKLTLSLPAAVRQQLDDYARIYARQFGQEEPVEELAVAMLADYLDNDRAFQKARREGS